MKDHNSEAKNNIDSCKLRIEEARIEIAEAIKNVNSKITKMIIVVVTAFSLFSVALFLANFSYNNNNKITSNSESIIAWFFFLFMGPTSPPQFLNCLLYLRS